MQAVAPDGSPVGSFPAAVAMTGSMFRFNWTVTERFDHDHDHDHDHEGTTPVLWVPDGTSPQGS